VARSAPAGIVEIDEIDETGEIAAGKVRRAL
jgi:hypothetical protein